MKLATNKHGKLRRFFSQKAVAEAFGLSVDTVRKLIETQQLTAVIVAGNAIRVPEEEIERFLQARRIGREFKPDTHPRGGRKEEDEQVEEDDE